MSDILNDTILQELRRISIILINSANKNNNEIYWSSKDYGQQRPSETIYSGTSGILLFFIELYKLSHDESYLKVIDQGKNWLIRYCLSEHSSNATFYTGRLGVVYTLIQIYELTKDPEVYKAALKIAKCTLKENVTVASDLLIGYAGVIQGLLFLCKYVNEDWVLENLNSQIEKLIYSSHLSFDEGVSWGRNQNVMKNLCGFSHGVSGIAYILMELGNFFSNDSFYWLARQALIYENNQFRKDTLEWPDYRKNTKLFASKMDFKNLSHSQVLLKFYTPDSFNYWCHGAIGIGMSRLIAYSIFNSTVDFLDVERAIKAMQNSRIKSAHNNYSYTLCHGLGGDVLFYLSANSVLNKPNYIILAREIIQKALNDSNLDSPYASGSPLDYFDKSLFMGIAGIGYMYLKYLNFEHTPNILCPQFLKPISLPTSKKYKFLNIGKKKLIDVLIQKSFPQTYLYVTRIKKNRKFNYSIYDDFKFIEKYSGFLKGNVIRNLKAQQIYKFECAYNKIKNSNHNLTILKDMRDALNLQNYKKAQLNVTNISLMLMEDIQIFKILNSKRKSNTVRYTFFLLKPAYPKQIKLDISDFCFELFNYCVFPKSYKEIRSFFINKYNTGNLEFEHFLLEQLNEAIEGRLLIPLLN